MNYTITTYNVKNGLMILLAASTFTCFLSCKKLVDVYPPTNAMSSQNVYSTTAAASAVLTGIYTLMSRSYITSGDNLTSVGFITGLTSDELTLYSGQSDNTLIAYYQNAQSSRYMNTYPWSYYYSSLFTINSAVEGLSNSQSLPDQVKDQLLGEAKFTRALYYFYLVNLYGDVPLITSTDYSVNMKLGRSSQAKIWDQIVNDLKDAQNQLSDYYLNATLVTKTNERVRPTKWAASALLARSYLYMQDWKNAEIQATSVINQSSMYHLDALNDVFKKNSDEAIWQLQPVFTGWNTQDARSYVLFPDYGPNGSAGVYISDQLLSAFEINDNRKSSWIDTSNFEGTLYYYPFKYKEAIYGNPVTEYQTILRLGELYLIRSEARAHQNNIDGAQQDLNAIRQRAGLNNTSANNTSDLLAAIMHERQVELFTEWGHRWFDLKRTNTINNVMSKVTPLKGGTWNANWQLFPIPFDDTQTDTNLKQNEGY